MRHRKQTWLWIVWLAACELALAQDAPTTAMPVEGVSIKDTSYPVPAGAVFVAPNGADTNAGTQAAPFKTIQKAIGAAPSGGTIVLREGTYREAFNFNYKTLTLQPYPHEKAWVKGSLAVDGWVADGSAWRKDGWGYQLDRSISSSFLDSSYPLAGWTDMAFIDGKPLKQVASRSEVGPGRFYVDYTNKRLYVGDNPSGRLVEAAAHQSGVSINGAGSVVRGIGFAHFPTPRSANGAVKCFADRVTFENNTVAWNATLGLNFVGLDSVARGNTVSYNGMIGMGAWKAHRLLVEKNVFSYNNQERFNIYWEAGGFKINTTENTTWRDNLVEHNIGMGMWWDGMVYNTTIVGNTVRHNTKHGIFYEISAKGVIASNVIHHNGGSGLEIADSGSDIYVYNNTLANNARNIHVKEDGRTDTHTSSYITTDIQHVEMRNNLFSNANSDMINANDYTRTKTAEQMGISANYNGYYRTSSSTPGTLVRWSRGSTEATYGTLANFTSGTGQEKNGLAIDNVSTNPFFVNEAGGDYALKSGSPAVGKGQPLPTIVANAIGVSAGTPVDLGALKWFRW